MPARPRRLAAGALLAGLTISLAAVAPAAPVLAASSWKETRTVEFSGSDLPKGCGTYSGAYAGGKSYWMPDDVRLKDGLLRLRLQKRVKNGLQWTSGGVGCWDWAQTYGRYEVRAKAPRGQGIDSYFTLWPTKTGDPAWTGVELLAPDVETAYVTNGYGPKGSENSRTPGTYTDGFHTYVIEWAPNLTRITVDDKVLFQSTKSYKAARWFGMVVSNGDALTGVPDATTPLPAEFQIDYVKISRYTGVAPAPRPTGTPVSRDRAPAAAPTGPAKVPSSTPPSSVRAEAAAAATAPGTGELAGGVWPWLLGGSLIAGLAMLILNNPWSRRRQERRR